MKTVTNYIIQEIMQNDVFFTLHAEILKKDTHNRYQSFALFLFFYNNFYNFAELGINLIAGS